MWQGTTPTPTPSPLLSLSLSLSLSSLLPSPSPTPTPSPSPSPSPSPTPTPPAQSLNVSTRLDVGTGDKFPSEESSSQRVRRRECSCAPSDLRSPISASPIRWLIRSWSCTLQTEHSSRATITGNSPQAPDIEATGLAPTNALESAIIATLDPGLYTAVVNGKDGGTGVGLVEAYDLDQSASSQLGNISTRGFVETGNNVMIGGFILGPGRRGTPMSLCAPSGLRSPTIRSDRRAGRSDSGTARCQRHAHQSNDNWRRRQQTEIEATGLQPTNDLESAIFLNACSGGYTAIVSGSGGTTGVALVEVYRLP